MIPAKNEKKKIHKFILGPRYHIVIIGANFAGIKAASVLPDNCRVTVIDPWPYFEFYPNIHELLSGIKKPYNLRLPRKSLVQGFGHKFIQDCVDTIDGEKNRIFTKSGKKLHFDFCILAVGGVNNTFGVEGADQFALPFKSVEDCQLIGKRLNQLSKSGDGMKIIIVGGGLLSLAALLRHTRDLLPRHVPAFVGVILLACFVGARALSFHQLNDVLDWDGLGLKLRWVMELAGIAVVGLCAAMNCWWYKLRPPVEKPLAATPAVGGVGPDRGAKAR